MATKRRKRTWTLQPKHSWKRQHVSVKPEEIETDDLPAEAKLLAKQKEMLFKQKKQRKYNKNQCQNCWREKSSKGHKNGECEHPKRCDNCLSTTCERARDQKKYCEGQTMCHYCETPGHCKKECPLWIKWRSGLKERMVEKRNYWNSLAQDMCKDIRPVDTYDSRPKLSSQHIEDAVKLIRNKAKNSLGCWSTMPELKERFDSMTAKKRKAVDKYVLEHLIMDFEGQPIPDAVAPEDVAGFVQRLCLTKVRNYKFALDTGFVCMRCSGDDLWNCMPCKGVYSPFCSECQESGHLPSECLMKEVNAINAEIADAEKSNKDFEMICGNCDTVGHMEQFCTKPMKKMETVCGYRCTLCHSFGHSNDDCILKGRSSDWKKSVTCFQCGEKGHMSKECPERPFECSNCGDYGHWKEECPHPSLESVRKNMTRDCPQNEHVEPAQPVQDSVMAFL